jgi:putative DNA primase/helicase
MFHPVEPWPDPVDGAALLGELVSTVHRFIVCDHHIEIAAALWCVFTWLVDHVQVAPLLVITAPEKRCGKSQLLNLVGRLCRRPLIASNISPSAVFRVIQAQAPTLLIDEAETFMRENEALRGIINSGHTRQSAYVIRTVGDEHEAQQFSTFGPKAIASIGKLPETVMDRAIVLSLRRKLSIEPVERLRHAEPELFDQLTCKLARFAVDAGPAIGRVQPALPDELNDRAQDNWEPLLAIADYVDEDWPDVARRAALKLSGADQDAVSISTELLADIQRIFRFKKVNRLSTAELLQALVGDELRPWATYGHGKPMAARQLAKRLGEYGIKPQTIRVGDGTAKGFMLDKFTEVFARYLPPLSVRSTDLAG